MISLKLVLMTFQDLLKKSWFVHLNKTNQKGKIKLKKTKGALKMKELTYSQVWKNLSTVITQGWDTIIFKRTIRDIYSHSKRRTNSTVIYKKSNNKLKWKWKHWWKTCWRSIQHQTKRNTKWNGYNTWTISNNQQTRSFWKR